MDVKSDDDIDRGLMWRSAHALNEKGPVEGEFKVVVDKIVSFCLKLFNC